MLPQFEVNWRHQEDQRGWKSSHRWDYTNPVESS